MKLSAPPPPPPPPPSDGTPGAGSPGEPNPNASAPAAPAAEAQSPGPQALDAQAAVVSSPEAASGVPTPADLTAPAPKPLRWPAWAPGVDAALAALALVLAFAAASFVAYNSDVWIHLAAGKRLLHGEYVPGSDPFSYTGADRAWVNHSWLADAGAYLLYGGEGKVLVIAKALAVALAFGVLLAIRRPRFPLWPWAAVSCVAVLAAAPQFVLRPPVLSMLFLAVTLFLLFRMPQKANSWRFPIAIGIAFWLWANCDAWFFLGPLALALALVGELIQANLLRGPEDSAAQDEEPLGRLPDVGTLARALGVGVLACMLNPNHVRVWELPFELVGSKAAAADPRLRALFLAPYDPIYIDNPGWGYNLNGLSYAVLLVGGAALLGFGIGRLRASHVALWLGFVILSLLSVYAIPFFAIVAVPLVAAQLNAFSTRAELKTWGDPRSRVLWIGSTAGRIACLLGACALCLIAYPGWAHPEPSNPAAARRVAWGVDVDPLLAQAAGQLDQWREREKLPPEARGVIASTELANYIAWFAPREKVFINARYNFHAPELPDYVQVRRGLGLVRVPDGRPNLEETTDVLRKAKADYLAVSSHPLEGFRNNTATLATATLYARWGDWSPWYLDGRTVVFGWRPEGEKAKPEFKDLRVDPVLQACGPNVERLPEPDLKQPLKELGWEEAFLRPAPASPTGATEARGWLLFMEGARRRQMLRDMVTRRLVGLGSFGIRGESGVLPAHPLVAGVAWVEGARHIPPVDPSEGSDVDALRTAPILALRAVRRAIAKAPDNPEPYFILAQVLSEVNLPLSESERALGRAVALRQCLIRLPSPEHYRRGQSAVSPTEVAVQLAQVYLGQQIPRRDPVTGQQSSAGYIGMPVDAAPVGELLGQAIFVDKKGNIVRLQFAAVKAGQAPPNMELLSGNTPYFLATDAAREMIQLALRYAEVDAGDNSPDAGRENVRAIEAYLKNVENDVVRGTQLYDQYKARGLKLPEQVSAALASSLPAKALELLSDADLAKEYKQAEPHAVILRVALELALGRIENANDLLKTLSRPDFAKTFDQTGLAPVLQRLEYLTAFHAGDYKAAGELLEKIEGRVVGGLDKLPPFGPNVPGQLIRRAVVTGYRTPDPNKALVGLLSPPIIPHPLLQSVMLNEWLGVWHLLGNTVRQLVLNQLQGESTFFYKRGLLSFLEGDIPAAKRRFEQATRKPPAHWGLPTVVSPEADYYKDLIRTAEQRALSP